VEVEADDIPTMRHLKRLVLLIASAILLPYPGAAATAKSRNPNQRHAKQDYRYKVPNLKYKAAKIKGHKPRH
jgi:hypothetical protein